MRPEKLTKELLLEIHKHIRDVQISLSESAENLNDVVRLILIDERYDRFVTEVADIRDSLEKSYDKLNELLREVFEDVNKLGGPSHDRP